MNTWVPQRLGARRTCLHASQNAANVWLTTTTALIWSRSAMQWTGGLVLRGRQRAADAADSFGGRGHG